jgi:hypothetical protein
VSSKIWSNSSGLGIALSETKGYNHKYILFP